jgi:uncharacterized protein (DUF1499 family)
MKTLKIALILLVGLVIVIIAAGQVGLLRGTQPEGLGEQNGRLKRPSLTPNSVSSQAALYPDHPQKEYASIEPIRFQGDGLKAMEKIAGILQGMERTTIITREPNYLYAQCTTKLLKFTDDIEFWLDAPAGVIQVRSSSRLGRKDLGVNRDRVESIRAQFGKN